MKVAIAISLTLTLVAVVHASYYYESDESGPPVKRLILDSLLGLPHPALMNQAELQRQMFALGTQLNRPRPAPCGNSVTTGDASATACGNMNFAGGAHGGSGGGNINLVGDKGLRKRYLLDIAGRSGQRVVGLNGNTMQNDIGAYHGSVGGIINLKGGQSSRKRHLLDIAGRHGQLVVGQDGNTMQNKIEAGHGSVGGIINLDGGQSSRKRHLLDIAGRHGQLVVDQKGNIMQNKIGASHGSVGGIINVPGGQSLRKRYLFDIAGRNGNTMQNKIGASKGSVGGIINVPGGQSSRKRYLLDIAGRNGNTIQNAIEAEHGSVGGVINLEGGQSSRKRHLLDIAGRQSQLAQALNGNIMQNMVVANDGSVGGVIDLTGGQSSRKRHLLDIAGGRRYLAQLLSGNSMQNMIEADDGSVGGIINMDGLGQLAQARQAINQNMILEQSLPPTKVECSNLENVGDTIVNSCGNTNNAGGPYPGIGSGAITMIQRARKRLLFDFLERQRRAQQAQQADLIHALAIKASQPPPIEKCGNSVKTGDSSATSCGDLNFAGGAKGGPGGGSINVLEKKKRTLITEALLIDREQARLQAQQDADYWHMVGLTQSNL